MTRFCTLAQKPCGGVGMPLRLQVLLMQTSDTPKSLATLVIDFDQTALIHSSSEMLTLVSLHGDRAA